MTPRPAPSREPGPKEAPCPRGYNEHAFRTVPGLPRIKRWTTRHSSPGRASEHDFDAIAVPDPVFGNSGIGETGSGRAIDALREATSTARAGATAVGRRHRKDVGNSRYRGPRASPSPSSHREAGARRRFHESLVEEADLLHALGFATFDEFCCASREEIDGTDDVETDETIVRIRELLDELGIDARRPARRRGSSSRLKRRPPWRIRSLRFRTTRHRLLRFRTTRHRLLRFRMTWRRVTGRR